MSIAVPIVLALALATSLYGQNESSWLNFQNWQAEQSDKSDDSAKDQPDKGADTSSDKAKPTKIWRGPGPKRLE